MTEVEESIVSVSESFFLLYVAISVKYVDLWKHAAYIIPRIVRRKSYYVHNIIQIYTFYVRTHE
jgi:hypothetical protein